MTAIIPGLIVVDSKLPVRNIAELIAYAKNNHSKKLTLGNPGTGTSGHLQCEYLKAVTKTDFTIAPYRGAGPMLNDFMAGQSMEPATRRLRRGRPSKAGTCVP